MTWNEFERVELSVGTVVSAEIFKEAKNPAIKLAIDFSLINEVSAEVGGMDYKELRRDKDFRRAVKYVVDQDMKNISVNSMKRTVEDIVERNCKVDGKKIRC